jgi:cysteinyl-tRNA synthetase
MTDIQLYNTRTRAKEPFRPLDPANVRMYVCGPTVYDRAHIGNARPVVVFDVLFRLLRHVYGADHVTYVRNFTDIDDKIIARAAETGRPINDITEETIGWYREDMKALGALPPTHEPRATGHIPQMVAMTKTLIEQGHAYEAEGHVLFAVDTYPAYGKLSRRSLDDMIAGSRVEVAPYKRSPMDFVLWKPSTDDQPGWESPWGRGRPGWHIECSAMAKALLGDTFDIHGGGIDLAFPHHENEVAQSCCANHTDLMANVWMHNEFLQVEGEKMAKSLGNFFTVKDLLDRDVPGEVIRFVLLMTHYRHPLDWTERRVQEAETVLKRWRLIIDGARNSMAPDSGFLAALQDDLNTPAAIGVLHELAALGNAAQLKSSAQIMGLLDDRQGGWFAAQTPKEDADKRIDAILALRSTARLKSQFPVADRIREALKEVGVVVQDRKDKTIYYIQDRIAQIVILNKKSKLERERKHGEYRELSHYAEKFGIHFSENDIDTPAAARVDRHIDLSEIRSQRLDALCEEFGVKP